MHFERNEAQQRAAELALQTEKLTQSLERLRGTSKNSLLAEVRIAVAMPHAHCRLLQALRTHMLSPDPRLPLTGA